MCFDLSDKESMYWSISSGSSETITVSILTIVSRDWFDCSFKAVIEAFYEKQLLWICLNSCFFLISRFFVFFHPSDVKFEKFRKFISDVFSPWLNLNEKKKYNLRGFVLMGRPRLYTAPLVPNLGSCRIKFIHILLWLGVWKRFVLRNEYSNLQNLCVFLITQSIV